MAATLAIVTVIVVGYFTSIGALGISFSELHGLGKGTSRVTIISGLVGLAFVGITIAAATLTAIVFIPIGLFVLIGAVPFPNEGIGLSLATAAVFIIPLFGSLLYLMLEGKGQI